MVTLVVTSPDTTYLIQSALAEDLTGLGLLSPQNFPISGAYCVNPLRISRKSLVHVESEFWKLNRSNLRRYVPSDDTGDSFQTQPSELIRRDSPINRFPILLHIVGRPSCSENEIKQESLSVYCVNVQTL